MSVPAQPLSVDVAPGFQSSHIPRRHNRVMRAIGSLVLSASGWQIRGQLPDLPRLIVIAAPHTSNWDFVYGMAAMFRMELRIGWMGKHSLFRAPYGWLMRWMGGVAIDRRAPNGVVGQMAECFRESERLWIGITPEGTRKWVPRWKMGFYHIALAAGVPVLPVALDYSSKSIVLGPLLWPGGDLVQDMKGIRSFYRIGMAKVAEKFNPDFEI